MPKSEKFWNRIARRYAKSPIRNIPAYNQTMDRTKAHLKSGDEVMEFGCGTGTTALILADSVKRITAVDSSANMIDIANAKRDDQRCGNVTFVRGSLSDDALNLKEGSFDAVLAFNILPLLEDLPATLRKFNALLKPDGVFISKTVCMTGQGRHWRILVGFLRAIGFAPYVRFFSPGELEDIITGEGFRIIETGTFPASPPSRFVVARKIEPEGST